MANKQRYRSGDRKERLCACDTGTAIEIGDLLWMDTDDVKPAASLTDQTLERWNQIKFANLFVGVAMEAHPANSGARNIRVATAGVFEFIAASDTYEIGTAIAIDEATSGTALENQTVVDADFTFQAIGRVAKREPTTTTTVQIEIEPRWWSDPIPAGSNWLYGDRNEILIPVDETTAIDIGDIAWLDADDAKNAELQGDQGNEGANQQLLHDVFCGIAMSAKAAGAAGTARFAQTGVFLFTQISAALNIGDLMSSDETGGTTLQDQVVVKVASANASIGRAAFGGTAAKAEVQIKSSMWEGGQQAIL